MRFEGTVFSKETRKRRKSRLLLSLIKVSLAVPMLRFRPAPRVLCDPSLRDPFPPPRTVFLLFVSSPPSAATQAASSQEHLLPSLRLYINVRGNRSKTRSATADPFAPPIKRGAPSQVISSYSANQSRSRRRLAMQRPDKRWKGRRICGS